MGITTVPPHVRSALERSLPRLVCKRLHGAFRHAHRGRRRAAPPQTTRRALAHPDAVPTSPDHSLLLAAASVAPIPARAAQVWTALASEKIRPATTARLRRERAHRRSAQRSSRRSRSSSPARRATSARRRASYLGPSARSAASGCIARRSSRCRRRPRSTARPGPGRTRSSRTWTSSRTSGGAPSRSRSPRARAAPSGWRCSCRPRRRRASTPAGSTVSWDGGAATVPVTLTVWPFTLPSSASLKTAFGFTYGAIPSGTACRAAGAFAELRERYGRARARPPGDALARRRRERGARSRRVLLRPPRSRAPRPPRCAGRRA